MGNVNNKPCRKNKESFNEPDTSSLIDDDDQHSKDKESMNGTTPPMSPSPSPSPIKKRHSKPKQLNRRWFPWKRNGDNKPTIKSLKKDNEGLKNEMKKLQNRIAEEQVERQTLISEKEGLINELEELRTRLSAVISAQVTDSNPNIADLSDKNRPTILAERYSELYDNQWTECYDGFTNTLKWEDKESITWILGLFINIFQTCEEKASKDLEQLREMLKEFQSGTTETLKTLKDKRKKSSMVPKDQITAKLDGRFAVDKQAIRIAEKFINESVELCWLMAVQDPPVYVDTTINKHGQPLDTNHYKYYTQKGKLVDYVVWPVLFLTIDGPLLSKGIAQGFVDQMQTEDNEQ